MCLGIPAEIITVDPCDDVTQRTGTVRFGHLTKSINLTCVPDAQIGDYVLVHAGIAIGSLHPNEVAPRQAALDSLVEPEPLI